MIVATEQLGPLRDFRRDLEAVHVRHVRVEQDELETAGRSCAAAVSASTAARPLATAVAVMPQRLTCSLENAPVDLVVVDDQHVEVRQGVDRRA